MIWGPYMSKAKIVSKTTGGLLKITSCWCWHWRMNHEQISSLFTSLPVGQIALLTGRYRCTMAFQCAKTAVFIFCVNAEADGNKFDRCSSI